MLAAINAWMIPKIAILSTKSELGQSHPLLAPAQVRHGVHALDRIVSGGRTVQDACSGEHAVSMRLFDGPFTRTQAEVVGGSE
ncbi:MULTISPECIES: hypothetical protein [Paraburkholderia]|uniref:hypothetical protein n=1 Tax=Paraburkholderia TaxID=1822464 RepID=UPI0038B703F5